MDNMPNRFSPLHGLSTSFFKSCCQIFAPMIAHVTNLSFASGKFPAVLETAVSTAEKRQVTAIKKIDFQHLNTI
jgi:hypothetical protein